MEALQRQLLSLQHTVQALHPLPEEDWHAFASLWQPFQAKRKEMLTAKGERERFLYFVTEGVQRIYYLDEAEREATLVFTYAPSFGGVLDAMTTAQPSSYYYETLTPSAFIRVPYAALERLMEERRSIAALVNRGLSGSIGGLLERMAELQCYTSEERFRSLLRRSPHILHLVPHKYLASYLGIDATNFSKLINRVKL